ncbi:PH and SEC7 domain-containing protein 4 [Platysternon megacephalum]|uniref:PH and SEC7 domain-containing protein 4 n=1 Tax=Platysternon megacephalum TaxID=55544 RepID=A0A4D9DJX0_9SAUR|nr:PH and SEC7 domain-containing protein 4 [Platysternon megacephalum]
MTCHEFVTNLDGMRDGQNFPKDQLKDAKATTYKEGQLARKVHAEADGKKSECRPSPRQPAWGGVTSVARQSAWGD